MASVPLLTRRCCRVAVSIGKNKVKREKAHGRGGSPGAPFAASSPVGAACCFWVFLSEQSDKSQLQGCYFQREGLGWLQPGGMGWGGHRRDELPAPLPRWVLSATRPHKSFGFLEPSYGLESIWVAVGGSPCLAGGGTFSIGMVGKRWGCSGLSLQSNMDPPAPFPLVNWGKKSLGTERCQGAAKHPL